MLAEIVYQGEVISVVKDGELLRSGDSLYIENTLYALGERYVMTAPSFACKSRYRRITKVTFKAFKV